MSTAIKTAIVNIRSVARRIAAFRRRSPRRIGGRIRPAAADDDDALSRQRRNFARHRRQPQSDAGGAHARRSGEPIYRHHQCRHVEHSRRRPGHHRALSAASIQEVVSEISINAQGVATVVWSDTLNGAARTVGQVVSVPSSLAVPNSYLLLPRCNTTTIRPTAMSLTGTMTLHDQIYRAAAAVDSSIARTAS